MKVLNLYSGIGGNRKLWKDVEITAIEWDPKIAAIYQDFFPEDVVIVTDNLIVLHVVYSTNFLKVGTSKED